MAGTSPGRSNGVLGRVDDPLRPCAGTPRLTPREVIVLHRLADGSTAAAIARRLSVSERTIHKHLEHLYSKLGVSDRLSAVMRAKAIGLLPF